MEKKVLAGFISVCLILGVFAGCGSAEQTFAEYKNFSDIISVED
jgi:hypothetical protein